MTATYNSVSVGGQEYDVYADLGTADEYMEAEVSAAATRWRDPTLTDDTAKARALVSATRLLDRQQWPGAKTGGAYQELAWPRSGTGLEGVEDDVIPENIIFACILLAAEINNGSNVTSADSTASFTRRQKAGSVEIEYFRDFSTTDGGARFPTAIQELLNGLLGSGTGFAGAIASGTGECSDFRYDYTPRTPN